MGKHKNRNRRGKSSSSSNDHKKKKKKNEEGEESSSLANAPAILTKLRHADPQTRLAALTALLHRPTTTTRRSNNNNKTKSPSSTSTQQQQDLMVFQAVREQVMDSNLTVASVAAACLEAYCHEQAACVVDNTDNTTDFATAGWYLVLLGRVQEGYRHVVASRLEPNDNHHSNHNHNHNNDPAKQQTQWLSLVVACFSAMTCLVQENPIVTERLERTPSLRHDSFDMLYKWCSWTVSSASSFQYDDDDPQRHVLQEHVTHLWHVLVEDNPQVVQPWYQERPEDATRILGQIYQWTLVAQDANPPTTLSDLSRLYLVGVLLAVKAQLPVLDDEEEESSSCSPPQGLHQIQVAPLLHYLLQCLRIPPSTTTAMDRATLCQTYQHAKEQRDDSHLERTVVRQQSVKQEPARAIARRLKQQQPQHDPAVQSTKGTQDTMVMEDEENDDNNMKRGELPTNRTDYAQEWQTSLDEWRRNHVLLELALEMTANLTASLVPAPHDNDSAQDHSTDMQVEPGPLDADLRRAFVDPQPTTTTTTTTRMEPFSSLLHHFTTQLALEWPPNVLRDMRDLQSKVSACVGHLVVQQQPVVGYGRDDDWMVDDERTRTATWIPSLWNDLVAALDQQPVVASTLIVLLQSPNAELLVASDQVSLRSDLDRFLKRVDQFSSTTEADAAADRDPVTAWRDCITLIGLLVCQMEHDAELNSRVCQSLIQSTQRACGGEMTNTKNHMVLAECLNVLMDIYGDDDRHPQVFEQLQVLNLFQTTLPRLKQYLNLARMRSSSSSRDDELEMLQEIAHNASRFIQYKKGHAC